MGKVCRNIRAQWDAESLNKACKAIQRGLSQQKAATQFGIPRRTLRNHLQSGKTDRKLGRMSILTSQQEQDLVTRIKRLAEVGYPITPQIMRHQVFKFVENNKIKHNFNYGQELAGRGWFRLFMKRHPELSIRKAQNMNPARAQKLNRLIVGDYFRKLEEILDTLDLKNKPERIFNMDEKGCRLTLHHQQSVLAKKGVKRLHLVAPEHAENATIVGCVAASGTIIPPMILFKGKRLKAEYEDNLPPGTLVKMAPKGSMTTGLFVEFIRHLSRFKIAGPILLIFDGAACHLDYTIVIEANRHNITLLCLPSNTTHELQPLDKSVYRSFEAHWDQEVLRFWGSHPDRRITKSRFNLIFNKVWSRCMTHENIVNGFRATGIYPYNESAIPFEAFAPSELTERPEIQPRPNSRGAMDSTEEFSSEDEVPLAQIQQHLSPVRAETTVGTGTEAELGTETGELGKKEVQATGELEAGTEDLGNSFQDLMNTPDLIRKKAVAPRRKALNYKAQIVKKSLFDTQTSTKSTEKSVKSKGKPKGTAKPQGTTKPKVTAKPKGTGQEALSSKVVNDLWYCPLCQDISEKDMRQCIKCLSWAHDECLGFTASDDENYLCNTCEK